MPYGDNGSDFDYVGLGSQLIFGGSGGADNPLGQSSQPSNNAQSGPSLFGNPVFGGDESGLSLGQGNLANQLANNAQSAQNAQSQQAGLFGSALGLNAYNSKAQTDTMNAMKLQQNQASLNPMSNFANVLQLQNANNQSQQNIAATQAQGSVLSALFGSLSRPIQGFYK